MKPKRLIVVEGITDFYVTYIDSELDWVAKFDKSWEEAEAWAHHMADVYNSRIDGT